MASPSSQLVTIARSDAFSSRVAYLVLIEAISVAAEDSGTADHAARMTFANKVMSGQVNAKLLAAIVLTDPYIAAAAIADIGSMADNVADASISARLAAVWTAVGHALA